MKRLPLILRATARAQPTRLQATLRHCVVAASFALGCGAATAQSVQYWNCAGPINGVASQAVLELAVGGHWVDGPPVAGEIRNSQTGYTFNGRMFGGVQGYVSLVDVRTGQRIDRVWIGLSQSGFSLRTEDGSVYSFSCQRR